MIPFEVICMPAHWCAWRYIMQLTQWLENLFTVTNIQELRFYFYIVKYDKNLHRPIYFKKIIFENIGFTNKAKKRKFVYVTLSIIK